MTSDGHHGPIRPLKILFLHQNAPGQFRHLAPHLAKVADSEVVFLGQTARRPLGRVRWRTYPAPRSAGSQTHHYLRRAEACVRRGQTVARACLTLREEGFVPDLVVGHPGWGETMFVREVLPRAAFLAYCEMYYRADGQDTGYIPETAIDLDGRCRIRAWNADLLTSLDIMDRGLSPTCWQRDQHPEAFRGKIAVIHEGVDLQEVAPNPAASFAVPNGPTFRPGDELVTYVARDLEPVRGFALLMRALPDLLRQRPRAHIVICGSDGVSYGRPAPGQATWREHLSRECPVDPARVHFVGKLPRPDYLGLLQVSALHLYLSVPFVLSWSCVEALATGCLVLGSDVAPVREAIEDGANGFLVDARQTDRFVARASELLAARAGLAAIRQAARDRAAATFDMRQCLAAQTSLIGELLN